MALRAQGNHYSGWRGGEDIDPFLTIFYPTPTVVRSQKKNPIDIRCARLRDYLFAAPEPVV
ncbi:MAG: hypothetical protein ACPGXK_12270, partial [Phycisphaerae bacterium]